MKIMLATHNENKVNEFVNPFIENGISIVAIDKDFPEIKETGQSYLENARLKAKAVSEKLNCIALGDDSGLEVECLNGEPGLYTARYADSIPFLENESKGQRLVRNMVNLCKDFPSIERSAKYICTLVLVFPDGKELVSTGFIKGIITLHPRGKNGFGHDPCFFIPELGKTMAELTLEEKNKFSHRGRAIKNMLTELKKML